LFYDCHSHPSQQRQQSGEAAMRNIDLPSGSETHAPNFGVLYVHQKQTTAKNKKVDAATDKEAARSESTTTIVRQYQTYREIVLKQKRYNTYTPRTRKRHIVYKPRNRSTGQQNYPAHQSQHTHTHTQTFTTTQP